MGKLNYKPLNVRPDELLTLKTALEGLLESEDFHIRNSYCGKIGEQHIKNILARIERLKGDTNVG